MLEEQVNIQTWKYPFNVFWYLTNIMNKTKKHRIYFVIETVKNHSEILKLDFARTDLSSENFYVKKQTKPKMKTKKSITLSSMRN
jgi:hypothetical protein